MMALRNGRPTRRYIIILVILGLFVYYSGVHLGRNAEPPKQDDQPSLPNYVRPNEHEMNRQDGFVEIDRELLEQREREARRRQIDQKFCGRDRCSFVLPVAITEQGM